MSSGSADEASSTLSRSRARQLSRRTPKIAFGLSHSAPGHHGTSRHRRQLQEISMASLPLTVFSAARDPRLRVPRCSPIQPPLTEGLLAVATWPRSLHLGTPSANANSVTPAGRSRPAPPPCRWHTRRASPRLGPNGGSCAIALCASRARGGRLRHAEARSPGRPLIRMPSQRRRPGRADAS
jgi:hypothetical protein